jgi:starch synthase
MRISRTPSTAAVLHADAMEILLASFEVGGLYPSNSHPLDHGQAAQTVRTLAKTLGQLEHAVTVVMPLHATMAADGSMLARRLRPLRFTLQDVAVEVVIYDRDGQQGTRFCLLDVQCDGESIFAASPNADDAAWRDGVWAHAVAHFARHGAQTGASYDVVHAYGWQTALVCHLLQGDPLPSVLTIHDAAQRSDAAAELGQRLELGALPAGVVSDGRLDMLAAGAAAANAVTTVSPAYAERLHAGDLGQALAQALQGKDVRGIAGGVDYAHWSPATDAFLTARFDAEDVANKGRCKATLLAELDGMSCDPERPLFVVMSRTGEAYGSDLVAEAVAGIVATGAQLVVAGDGNAAASKTLCQAIEQSRPDAIFLDGVDEKMVHRLLSAADALIIASRSDRVGDLELRAQRYGAAPVALVRGAVHDSVVDCDAQLATGTGFLFDADNAEDLLGSVQRCVAALATKGWGAFRRRMMRQDRSFERPARRLERLYGRLGSPAS